MSFAAFNFARLEFTAVLYFDQQMGASHAIHCIIKILNLYIQFFCTHMLTTQDEHNLCCQIVYAGVFRIIYSHNLAVGESD